MANKTADTPSQDEQRLEALSRWDADGGASPPRPREASPRGEDDSTPPSLTNAELVQMRIRIIALENLVIALLAGAPAHQIELAREISAYIAPRPGNTPHPLTLRAARQMDHLVMQAGHFRVITQP